MKGSALEHAIRVLEGKDVLVSYSCGKDSMIVLDLARRVGARVEAFTMELVPGLRVMKERLAWAEARWNVKIRRYPHWLRAHFAREGVYGWHPTRAEDVVRCDIEDIYTIARADAGIALVVTGAKKGDSLWRRRTGAIKFAADDLKAPLWDWSSRDVFGYLRARELPIPTSDGRAASGIDLTEECVTWLHDEHPADYAKLEAAYPFVGAVVLRRARHGDRAARAREAKAEARRLAEQEAGNGEQGSEGEAARPPRARAVRAEGHQAKPDQPRAVQPADDYGPSPKAPQGRTRNARADRTARLE